MVLICWLCNVEELCFQLVCEDVGIGRYLWLCSSYISSFPISSSLLPPLLPHLLPYLLLSPSPSLPSPLQICCKTQNYTLLPVVTNNTDQCIHEVICPHCKPCYNLWEAAVSRAVLLAGSFGLIFSLTQVTAQWGEEGREGGVGGGGGGGVVFSAITRTNAHMVTCTHTCTHMHTHAHTSPHPHTLTPSQVIGIVLTCWYRNQKDPNANPSAFLWCPSPHSPSLGVCDCDSLHTHTHPHTEGW